MKKITIILIITILLSIPVTSFALDEENYITRGEFIKELLPKTNINIENIKASSFVDVTNTELIPYIEAAFNEELISGYENMFKPNNFITKEEAVIIIVNTFGVNFNSEKIPQDLIDTTLNFSDKSSISSWAKPFIAYAIDNEFINERGNAFYPQMQLTKSQAKNLIRNAKKNNEELFTMKKLAASDMLIFANKKLNTYKTYKQKGSFDMKIMMNIEGDIEELENDPAFNELINEGINMKVDIDAQTETPDKTYIKEIITGNSMNENIEQEIELFMNGTVMYTKMTGLNKWTKQDISPIFNQLQSYSDNDLYNMSQLSEKDFDYFKDYITYGNDIKIGNKDCYVIKINIDKDTYKKYVMETFDKAIETIVDLQNTTQGYPEFDREQYKEIMTQIINNMEIEAEYKYYLDKETKCFEKIGVAQDIYMSMENIVSMFANASGENSEENKDIDIVMQNHSEGEFLYYDFNAEVNFPVINEPEDLFDIYSDLYPEMD
jgi:hypothetical protein